MSAAQIIEPNASRRWLPPWDRPRFHRLDLSAKVLVGSGGRPGRGGYRSPDREVECVPYGGLCLGDNCIHWFPLPSPARCQEATCGLSRRDQPIALREARRKLGQNIMLGNECLRLGWAGSAQIAFQRAWAYAVLVAEIEETQDV